jgi:hypothetical protein
MTLDGVGVAQRDGNGPFQIRLKFGKKSSKSARAKSTRRSRSGSASCRTGRRVARGMNGVRCAIFIALACPAAASVHGPPVTALAACFPSC